MSPAPPLLRIGELARRAGIPPATLRAWERRYGIVEPERTESGYRLYSEEDERRLKRMVDLITRGAAPAEAAARVGAEVREREAAADNGDLLERAPVEAEPLQDELYGSLMRYDEPAAHRSLDRAVAAYGVEVLLTDVILPVLRRIGESWRRSETSVGQEHFASNLIRGRLMALTRGWAAGAGPKALLACPPQEEHDLGLVSFGLMLRERGWRITLLGTDTPFDALSRTAGEIAPDWVVLAVTTPQTAEALDPDRVVSLPAPIAIAGAAAGQELADRLGGARLLTADIRGAAEELAATV